MSNIFRFPPPASQGPTPPLSMEELCALLEDAAQVTLDAVDRILAARDRVGQASDGRTAEPRLGSPRGHTGQIARLRSDGPDDVRPSPVHGGRPRRRRN